MEKGTVPNSTFSESRLEVCVAEGFDKGVVRALFQIDCGQGHAVEGVVLDHGVDGHILEYEGLALFERGIKAVLPYKHVGPPRR